MAPVVPDPRAIKSFRTQAAFAAWMKANHARATEIWLKIHKKESGLPTVSNTEALANPEALALYQNIEALRT